jgi:hypothetical protein
MKPESNGQHSSDLSTMTNESFYVRSASSSLVPLENIRNNSALHLNSESGKNKDENNNNKNSLIITSLVDKLSLHLNLQNQQSINGSSESDSAFQLSSCSSSCSSISSTKSRHQSPQHSNSPTFTASFSENSSKSSSGNSDQTRTVYTTVTTLRGHPDYKMHEKIRSGGFGDVYRGTRKSDDLPIAIKIIGKKKISSWTIFRVRNFIFVVETIIIIIETIVNN